jgi:hypothetical protein
MRFYPLAVRVNRKENRPCGFTRAFEEVRSIEKVAATELRA